MPVNKVIFGGETLIDITDSTVTTDTMLVGSTAYDASGKKIEGTLEIITMEDFLKYIGRTN